MAGFTGISFPFRVGVRGNIALSTTGDTNIDHIKESIIQILGTQIGERVMEPEFGSDLKSMVFESLDSTLISVIKLKIAQPLKKWEPRISVSENQISVATDNEGTIICNIQFTVLQTQVSGSLIYPLRTAV